MYSTCIYCHSRLGVNEAIEHLPVGRRIAFDSAKGRLWVVCPTCRQWNLSPLDERWEAIEDAERLYRDTRLRASTDEIGLARLKEGTELVRIGRPLLPEFAAWRYGERFTGRWIRYMALSVSTAVIGYSIGPLLGVGLGAIPVWGVDAIRRRLTMPRFAARVEIGGEPAVVSHEAAALVRVEAARNDPLGWRLLVPVMPSKWTYTGVDSASLVPTARYRVEGPRALDAMRQLLPQVNADGGLKSSVRAAVTILSEAGDLRATVDRASEIMLRDQAKGLARLPTALRLALEMAVHEDVERRAIEGELESLRGAWKEAEEIADIADSLTLPQAVLDRWKRITGRDDVNRPG